MCVSAGVRRYAGAGGGAVRPRPGAGRRAWEGARAARSPQPPPRDPCPPSRERGRAPRRTWAPEVAPPRVLGRGLTGTSSRHPLSSAGAEARTGSRSSGTRPARSGPAPALPVRGPELARLGAPGCPERGSGLTGAEGRVGPGEGVTRTWGEGSGSPGRRCRGRDGNRPVPGLCGVFV